MSEEENTKETEESPDIEEVEEEGLTATTEDDTSEEPLETENLEHTNESEEVTEDEEALELETKEDTETIEETEEELETTEAEKAELVEEELDEAMEEQLEVQEELMEEVESEEEDEEPIEAKEELEEDFEIPAVPITEEDSIEEETEEEFEIPGVPLEAEEATKVEEMEEEVTEDEEALELRTEEDEDTFEVTEEKKPKRKKRKAKQALPFLIGLGIGLVVAIVAEIVFSIPAWRTGTSRPDLYFAEMVVILIALMLPGLLTRSIQRGLLGGAIIFAISFALPFLTALAAPGTIILNPLTPLFSSTDFALDAYDVFQSLFSIDFDMASIQKWIWIIDLVIMFILMVIVVTLGSALIKNITFPKKKAKHWVAIPFLSLGLIVFIIIAPISYSSTYGIIQASSAFLAGSSQLSQAYGVFEGNVSDLQTQDAEIQALLNDASYWFNISQANYVGLRNIGVINFAILVSGQYGPLIQTGDQLALATLSFTQVLYPLFSGIFELTDSFNDATNSMANFGQSESLYSLDDYMDDLEPNNVDDLPQLKEDILSAIEGMENAQEALNIVLNSLDTADVAESFDDIEQTLSELDLDSMPDRIANIIDQVRSRISEYKGQVTGFIDFIGYANESLTPTKNILLVAYYTIVGNEYSKVYDFDLAYEAYDNATKVIDEITAIPEYTPDPLLGDIFAVEITEGFNLLLSDIVSLMDPLLDEQKSFAQTYQIVNQLMQVFIDQGNNIALVDYIAFNDIPKAIVSAATTTKSFGFLAEVEAQEFLGNIESGIYGSTYESIAIDMGKILTQDFKPEQFGNFTSDLASATQYFWYGCGNYSVDNFVDARDNLLLADNIMQDVLSSIVSDEMPDYYENYLAVWTQAIRDIYISMDTNDSLPEKADGITEIDGNLTQLQLDIAVQS